MKNYNLHILIHALAVRQHGGTARHLFNFLPALGEYSPENYYTLYVDEDALLPQIPPNITVHRVSVRSSWRRVIWDTTKLPAIAKQKNVDAIWNLLGFGMLDTSIPQIMFQRVPGYYCHHYLNAIGRRTRWESILRRWWQACVMRRSMHIIPPTAAMREMIRYHHPDLPQEKFTVLHHAFTPTALDGELPDKWQIHLGRLPDDAVKLLYVGHILPYKDLEFMLEVFALAQQRSTSPLYWYLTIASEDWPEGYARFVEKRKELGLEEKVILLGKLPGEIVGAWYQACDIVTFTSLCESFGWPLVEATGLAKPMLAVDVPLNRELAGAGAKFYNKGDREGAVSMLLSLAEDRDERQRVGKLGREHFEKTHVNWEQYITCCQAVTTRVIAQNN